MTPRKWLARPETPPDARLRLVCFAHSGGGAAQFIRMGRDLPPGVALCPMRRPGRETNLSQPSLTTVGAIADGAFAALRTLPTLPTILLGHSLGASVAFEVARRMEALGRSPLLLIASARRPPHIGDGRSPIGQLPDAAFLDALDERYGGIPAEVRAIPELMAMMLPPLRADLQASERYAGALEPRLSCAVQAWGGADDRAMDPATLKRWAEVTRGPFESRVSPGGHFYLFEQPDFKAALLGGLKARLAALGTG